MAEGFVRPAKDGALVRLRVSPGAKSTCVKGLYGEVAVRLSVAAPPVDGKANAAAERFLAEIFGVHCSGVSVVGGVSSRDKTVLVHGAEPGEVRACIDALL